jgi:hypothetical protein
MLLSQTPLEMYTIYASSPIRLLTYSTIFFSTSTQSLPFCFHSNWPFRLLPYVNIFNCKSFHNASKTAYHTLLLCSLLRKPKCHPPSSLFMPHCMTHPTLKNKNCLRRAQLPTRVPLQMSPGSCKVSYYVQIVLHMQFYFY